MPSSEASPAVGLPACANATARPTRDPIARRDLHHAFIKQYDFLPLGVTGFCAAGVAGLNHGLELKTAKTFEPRFPRLTLHDNVIDLQ
jgi:hypothetical protein